MTNLDQRLFALLADGELHTTRELWEALQQLAGQAPTVQQISYRLRQLAQRGKLEVTHYGPRRVAYKRPARSMIDEFLRGAA